MALTRITEGVIKPNENYVVNNINSSGVTTSTNFKTGTSNLHNVGIEIAGINVLGADTPIGTGATIYDAGGAVFTGVVTATSFSGSGNIGGVDGNFSGNVTGVDATFSGNVSVGGTLTYEDVTNVDAVGLVTARNGIDCNGDLDVDGHTNLDNVSIAGVTTITGASGTLLQFTHTAGSGGQAIVKTKATQANSSSFIRVEDSGSTYIGLLKYGTGHSAYGALGAGDGALYANSGGGNDTNITIMADSSTGYINFATGGNTERLRIDSDGQIGIGNITPDTWSTGKSITIGTSQATLFGVSDQVNLSGNAYFNSSWKAAATKAGASQIQQALGNIDFKVSGSVTADAAITWIDALRITKTGNVGIGSVTPSVKLDVEGGTKSTQYQLKKAGDSTSIGGYLQLTNQAGDSNSNDVTLSAAHSTNSVVLRAAAKVSAWTYYNGGWQERLHIANAGNVGINTDVTSQKLTVRGTILRTRSDSATGLIYLQDDGSHNGQVTINDSTGTTRIKLVATGDSYLRNGRFGIGIDTLGSQFSVYETATGQLTALRIGNTNTPSTVNDKRIEFLDGTGTTEGTNKFTYGYIKGYRKGGANNGGLIFATKLNNASHPAERLRIDDSGRVGINYAASPPSETIHISAQDSATSTGVSLSHVSSGNRYGGRIDTIAGTTSGINVAPFFNSTYWPVARFTYYNSTEKLQIGSTNNTVAGTKLIVGTGNNMASTALINTQDTDIDALTLSNWDGSTTTNRVFVAFDSSGRGGFKVGMPAATDAFVVKDWGGAEYVHIDATGRIGFKLTPGVWNTNNQTVLQLSATNGGLNLFTRSSNAFLTNNFWYKSDDAGVFQSAANYALMQNLDAANGQFKFFTTQVVSSSANSSASLKELVRITQQSDREWPTVMIGDGNNGNTYFGDYYHSGQGSRITLGTNYSGAGMVLSYNCKPAAQTANAWVSSQNAYSDKRSSLTMGGNSYYGLAFYSNNTASQDAVGNSVTMHRRLGIDHLGKMTINSDNEHQIDVQATNAAGSSIRCQSAGAYAYYVAHGSQRIWRWGMPTGSSTFVIRDATTNKDRLFVHASGALSFNGTGNCDNYGTGETQVFAVEDNGEVRIGGTSVRDQRRHSPTDFGRIKAMRSPNPLDWGLDRKNSSFQDGDSISAFSGTYNVSYTLNGTGTQNRWVIGTGPSGGTEWLWSGVANGGRPNDQGGWNSSGLFLNPAYSYVFINFVKRVSSNYGGNYYFGTSGIGSLGNGAVSNVSNPYWACPNTQTLPHNVWCVDYRILHSYYYDETVASASEGTYRMDTGAQIMGQNHCGNGNGYKFYDYHTGIRPYGFRSYLYYATVDSGVHLQWAQPHCYKLDGYEMKLSEILETHTSDNANCWTGT